MSEAEPQLVLASASPRRAVFVLHLDGSYSGVMGLPLFETARLLGRAGVAVLTGRR